MALRGCFRLRNGIFTYSLLFVERKNMMDFFLTFMRKRDAAFFKEGFVAEVRGEKKDSPLR